MWKINQPTNLLPTSRLIIIVLLGFLFPAVLFSLLFAAGQNTIQVNSTDDSLVPANGQCTLREAINNANQDNDTTGGDCSAGSGDDVILLPAGVYTLTIPGPRELFNQTGDLNIRNPLTIEGEGAENTIINANGLDRAIRVQAHTAPFNVILDGITVRGGFLDEVIGNYGGAGIRNDGGNLFVTNCVLMDNYVEGYPGGGILSLSGNLHIDNCDFLENISFGQADLFDPGGGGVSVETADNLTMTVTIANSTFISNSASLRGGGLYGLANQDGHIQMLITDTLFQGNVSTEGGAIGFNATHQQGMSLFLQRVQIRQNAGEIGGGLHAFSLTENGGDVHILESTIEGNSVVGENVGGGGAYIMRATLWMTNTTLSGNLVDGEFMSHSGGLFLESTDAHIVNSTISGNHVSGDGPIGDLSGVAGGIGIQAVIRPVEISLLNTTIANNSTSVGGAAIMLSHFGASADMFLKNVVFEGNETPTGDNCVKLFNGTPPDIISQGHNMEDADTCDLDQNTDQPNTAALLGPLADNGGTTWTHALPMGSPAVDTGGNDNCPTTDQRGVTRPLDGDGDGEYTCDIGAFEADFGFPTPTPIATTPPTHTPTPDVTATPDSTATPTVMPSPTPASGPFPAGYLPIITSSK